MELKTRHLTMSNSEMKAHLQELAPILKQRNMLGYLAAYNTRVFTNALQEYSSFEREAIMKYGVNDLDEQGFPTGTKSIQIGSPEYKEFIKELRPYLDIEQEVSIAIAKYESVINILSGEEILELDWMLDGEGIEWPE